MKLFATLTVAALLLTGCQSESVETPTAETPAATETTPVAFNVDGAPTVNFSVPDMMCAESCAVKVEEVLAAQTGVSDVRVDFDTKTATVAVDNEAFDAEAAVAALVDVQFGNTKLKEN